MQKQLLLAVCERVDGREWHANPVSTTQANRFTEAENNGRQTRLGRLGSEQIMVQAIYTYRGRPTSGWIGEISAREGTHPVDLTGGAGGGIGGDADLEGMETNGQSTSMSSGANGDTPRPGQASSRRPESIHLSGHSLLLLRCVDDDLILYEASQPVRRARHRRRAAEKPPPPGERANGLRHADVVVVGGRGSSRHL